MQSQVLKRSSVLYANLKPRPGESDTPHQMEEQPDPETHVEMTSFISALSSELLDRIFAFLSEDKQAIAACRLVCRLFKDSSSQYLITRVVFARRLKTIARLNEIVAHEYFHKYVKELVCDLSYYCENRATDWDTYVQACFNAPQQLQDPEWMQRKLEDRTIWSEIEQLVDNSGEATNSAYTRPSNCDRDKEPEGAWARDEGGEQPSDNDLSETVDDDILVEIDYDDKDEDDDSDDDVFSEWSRSPSFFEDGALRYYDRAYNLGCHKSFPDYHRLYIAERQINRKNAAERIVGRALSRLTRLNSVVVTDWRSFASPDESYSDCARRLFGNTLAPNLTTSLSSNPLDMLFEELVCAIEDNKDVRVKHFSTGSHCFGDETHHRDDPRAPICIPWRDVGCMSRMIAWLRLLRLSLYINTELLEHLNDDIPADETDEFNEVRRTLSKAANLEHLALTVQLPEGQRRLGNLDQVKELFSTWLADIHFPHLKTLYLQGWVLPQKPLEEFLARHASTFRAVHFIDCLVIGDRISLASWAGKALNLDGIEICLTSGMNAYGALGELDGTVEEVPVDKALIPENESAWLAGQPNFIVRGPLSGSLEGDGPTADGVPWWEKNGRKQI